MRPLCVVRLALGACSLAVSHGLHPPCRKSPEMHTLWFQKAAPSNGSQRLLVFGGKGYTWKPKKHKGWKKHVTLFGDTWSFDIENQTWDPVQLAGRGSGNPKPHPSPRWKPSSTVTGSGSIVLFGGCTNYGIKGVMNDLWVFSPLSCCPASGQWWQTSVASRPPSRRGHVMVATSRHIIIFGGKGYSKKKVDGTHAHCLADLWMLPIDAVHNASATGASWTRGDDFPGSCRWGATASVLSAPDGREFMAVFGGRVKNRHFAEHSTASGAYTYYNELWLYDAQAANWTLARPTGLAPPARDHHAAVVMDGDLYIYGGRINERRDEGSDHGDLWSYSLRSGSWTLHSSVGATPEARYMPAMAAIQWRGHSAVAVFGGETLPGSTSHTSRNDVWVYRPTTSTWTLLSNDACSPDEVLTLVEQQGRLEAGGLTSTAMAVAALAAAAGMSFYALQTLRSLCQPAAARCLVSADTDSISSYECMT